MKKRSLSAIHYISIAITASFLFLFFIKLYYLSNKPFPKYFMDLLHSFYQPNVNIFGLVNTYGKSIDYYLYAIIFISIFLSMLICRLFLKSNRENVIKIPFYVTFTAFIIIVSLQMMAQYTYLIDRMHVFSRISVNDKYALLYTRPFLFSEIVHNLYPGHYHASIISDLDFDSDDAMLTHRTLAYFLYPIDIRNIRPDDSDELILIFNKTDAKNFVPPDFKTIHVLTAKDIIASKQSSSL